ncbi:MAG: hypothetical protein ACXV7G_14500, partial [Halobacteriota archaeon]
ISFLSVKVTLANAAYRRHTRAQAVVFVESPVNSEKRSALDVGSIATEALNFGAVTLKTECLISLLFVLFEANLYVSFSFHIYDN